VSSRPAPRTVGEIDTFVTMLLAACEDESMHGQLERLLSLPDAQRQATIHAWVTDLLVAEAPPDFIQAVASAGPEIDVRVARGDDHLVPQDLGDVDELGQGLGGTVRREYNHQHTEPVSAHARTIRSSTCAFARRRGFALADSASWWSARRSTS